MNQKRIPLKPEIAVVYEDENCIGFNKPARLLVIPTQKNETHTLVSLVNQGREASDRLYPVHRLDRDTSGVILFAKAKDLREKFMELFKAKKVRKVYMAVVHGRLMNPQGKIRIPIKDFHQRKFARHLPAQSALTYYKVIDYAENFTVVEVMPVTGRTNQIRIHFAKIGHPLLGEDKYAFRRDFALRFRRCALHALSLEWPDLNTGRMIKIEAPLAQDMKEFLMRDNKTIR